MSASWPATGSGGTPLALDEVPGPDRERQRGRAPLARQEVTAGAIPCGPRVGEARGGGRGLPPDQGARPGERGGEAARDPRRRPPGRGSASVARAVAARRSVARRAARWAAVLG